MQRETKLEKCRTYTAVVAQKIARASAPDIALQQDKAKLNNQADSASART
jgi:hypothetical protein